MYVRRYTKDQVPRHPRFHQSTSAKVRNRQAGRREVAVLYRELVVYVQTKLYGLRKLNFFRHLSFHTCYSLGVFLWGLFGALLLTQTDGFFFVDALLLSVSAFCEAGLAPMSMLVISHRSFVVLTVLVFFGNAIMMLIYPLAARTYYFRKVLRNITAVDKAVLDEYRLWHEGTMIFVIVLFLYMTLSICVGIVVLYLSLQLFPPEPEMLDRGFSPLVVASFSSLSAFANAGFALSSSQLEYYQNNPLFYTTLAVLILLGNTASPIVLRWCMAGLHSFLHAVKHRFPLPGKYINIHAVKYVLDNPRRITTNLFSRKETNFLGYVLVAINLVQYLLYLASTLNRKEALAEDSKSTLAAIGVFQTISTRTAGFQIVQLRDVNQGMLVVYALAMYLSAAPFLSTMYLTEDNVEKVSQLSTLDESDSSEDSDEDMDSRFRAPTLKRAETVSFAQNIKNNFMTKHIYYLLFAVVLLAFTEDGILSHKPEEVNLWYILFEVASAYGTVGLSLGLPGRSYSLVGAFSASGKLIITAVIFLGKHRGLPQPTDAVIDFKFNRLKRASRRKAKASLKVAEKPRSMIQNVINSVQSRVEAISPRTPRKKKESKGIAILELKPREKRKSVQLSNKDVEGLPAEPVSPAAITPLKRVGSYQDPNPNLPAMTVEAMHAEGRGPPEPEPDGISRNRSQRRSRRKPAAAGESMDGALATGISPVDKLLSHIGVLSPQEEDNGRPFVYSPRIHKRKSDVGREIGDNHTQDSDAAEGSAGRFLSPQRSAKVLPFDDGAAGAVAGVVAGAGPARQPNGDGDRGGDAAAPRARADLPELIIPPSRSNTEKHLMRIESYEV